MKYVDEYRDGALAGALLEGIKNSTSRELKFMEVCGSHTVAIFKSGIRDLLPKNISLVSGPGCPVCVTAVEDVDRAVALARIPEVILATFGDMVRVPGSDYSLNKAKAEGADVRIVYSPFDALTFAKLYPNRKVVFFAAGFETTSPAVAATLARAGEEGITNFFLLSVHKTIPGAMRALLDTPELQIDGFLCPGHVSTIIGSEPYSFITDEYKRAAVVAGFEPVDILQSTLMMIKQIEESNPRVEIQYRRAVSEEGNPKAREVVDRHFEPADSNWRGIGVIPGSGLKLRPEFAAYDAEKVFDIKIGEPKEAKGCSCGKVLQGIISPPECKLFGKVCTPEAPVGACMVSYEGSCAAYYKYGRR
ncbi:MAG TPA: hydrogenase formation protein HypD [Nitrospirota bacterium]|jgi:hydrogenase expression/formation protein HypD